MEALGIWALLLVGVGSLIWLLFAAARHRDWALAGQVLVAVLGPVLVSAVTIRIQRPFLAYPVALASGLALAGAVMWWRQRRTDPWVSAAVVLHLIAFWVLSLRLDWFDGRGVGVAALLLVPAVILSAPGRRPAAITRIAACGFLLAGALVAVLLRIGLERVDRMTEIG